VFVPGSIFRAKEILITNTEQARKKTLTGTNTPAYFASASATSEKKFRRNDQIANDDHSTALEIFRDLDVEEEIVLVSQKILNHAELTLSHCDVATTGVTADAESVTLEYPIVLFLKGMSTILRRKTNVDTTFVDEFCDAIDGVCKRFSIFKEFGVKVSILKLSSLS
jgi:hypothetical protein